MKTWELLKRIDEMGEECIGEKYKLINVNKGVRIGDIGMVATVREFIEFRALAHKGTRLSWITGCEEWERVEEKYYLQDTFIRKSNEQNSYLNRHYYLKRFIISNKDTLHADYQVEFTNEDIKRLGIPVERYKKIKVEGE